MQIILPGNVRNHSKTVDACQELLWGQLHSVVDEALLLRIHQLYQGSGQIKKGQE